MTDTDGVVRSFYGRWARAYDRIADLPPVAGWREQTAASLGLTPGDAVVEMGCGTGANLPYLRERVGPDGRVVGIDLTRGMLRQARERDRAPGSLVQADATRPPIDEAGTCDADDGDDTVGDDTSVDAVLGTFVVGMFDDPAPVVETWCDLVAPDGRVGLLHFHESDRSWAAPANALYRALVRFSSPNATRAAGAAAEHDSRVRHAHDVLETNAAAVERRELAGGFLRLVVGQLPEA